MTNVPTSLNNLETKVDDLDVGKLKTLPVDLKKISDVVDNEVIQNTKFKTLKKKVNNLEKKIPDTTTLIHINQYNIDKKKNFKNSEVESKVPNTSNLVTTTALNTKIRKVVNEILDKSKFIANHEFNKLTAEANLVSKTDFDKKLKSFNKRLTSNKIKHLEVQKKLNSLVTKDNNFF